VTVPTQPDVEESETQPTQPDVEESETQLSDVTVSTQPDVAESETQLSDVTVSTQPNVEESRALGSIVMLLCVSATEGVISAALWLQDHHEKIYIIPHHSEPTRVLTPKVTVYSVASSEAERHGYKDTVSFVKGASSRCKALFALRILDLPRTNVWMIEEDVFVPRPWSLKRIDDLHKKEDLLLANHRGYSKGDGWSHWKRVPRTLSQPWFCGLTCAIRVSPALLHAIHSFADTHRTLFFCEIMFSTLAEHNRLSIACPEELRVTVQWRYKWREAQLIRNANHIFHPVKDHTLQMRLRNRLGSAAAVAVSQSTPIPARSTPRPHSRFPNRIRPNRMRRSSIKIYGRA
jgi:hypothetical protein